MLLHEIAFTKTKNQAGITQYKPNMAGHQHWDIGVISKVLRPTAEQLHIAEKHGMVDVAIPIMSAYRLPQKPEIGKENHFARRENPVIKKPEDAEDIVGVKHALKSRDPNHVMDPEDIKEVCRQAIIKILGVKRTDHILKGVHTNTLKRINEIQQLLKDKNSVLVPIGSSSPLSKTFTSMVSEATGLQILDVLSSKQKTMSSKVWNKNTQQYEDRLNDVGRKTTQMKNVGLGQKDFRDGYYGGQEITNPDVFEHKLHDKNIIFVDDNFESGVSITHAVMAFLEMDIVPRKFAGIAIHYLI